VRLKLRLSKKVRRAARLGLAKHETVRVKVKVAVRDARGRTASKSRTIRLRLR
jgi:hypothetical protein